VSDQEINERREKLADELRTALEAVFDFDPVSGVTIRMSGDRSAVVVLDGQQPTRYRLDRLNIQGQMVPDDDGEWVKFNGGLDK
jgi:hypothetical protein